MGQKVPGHVRNEDRKVYKLRERIRKLEEENRELHAKARNLKDSAAQAQETAMSRGQRITDLEAQLRKLPRPKKKEEEEAVLEEAKS